MFLPGVDRWLLEHHILCAVCDGLPFSRFVDLPFQ